MAGPLAILPAVAAVAARAIPAVASAAGRAAASLAGRAASGVSSSLSSVASRGGAIGRGAGAASRSVANLSPMFQARAGSLATRTVSDRLTSAVNRVEQQNRAEQQASKPNQRVSNNVSSKVSSVAQMMAQGGMSLRDQANRSSM